MTGGSSLDVKSHNGDGTACKGKPHWRRPDAWNRLTTAASEATEIGRHSRESPVADLPFSLRLANRVKTN